MTATKPTMCLCLSREDFMTILGPLEDIIERTDDGYQQRRINRRRKREREDICMLQEFKTLGMLGKGAFGCVTLVQDPVTSKAYALKEVSKLKVMEMGAQRHMQSEKD